MSEIFVFGSNLAGRHGAGAAKFAKLHHGAIYGQGKGLQGNSYAIPTKGLTLEVLSLNEIRYFVARFIDTAKYRPDLTFNITPIGCGLAGYKREQIRPLFDGMPSNCVFTKEWDA